MAGARQFDDQEVIAVALDVFWRKGLHDATMQDLAAATGVQDRTSGLTTWNTTIGYQFSNKLTLRLNVNNIQDRIAPADPTYNSYPYYWTAYSPIGRTIGVEASYKFSQ